MRFSRFAFCALVVAACAAACGTSSDDTDAQASDGSVDQTTTDAPKESAPSEASPGDASTDTTPEASQDATLDVTTLDALPDVLADVLADAPADVVSLDAGGCLTNADCQTTDYCERGNGVCAGAGTCTARPQNCFQLVSPVCGCNHMTYINSCYAHAAGETIAYTSTCE